MYNSNKHKKEAQLSAFCIKFLIYDFKIRSKISLNQFSTARSKEIGKRGPSNHTFALKNQQPSFGVQFYLRGKLSKQFSVREENCNLNVILLFLQSLQKAEQR